MYIILIHVLLSVSAILSLYNWIIFITIILNLLFAFGILDFTKNRILSNIYVFGKQVTDPIFNFFRRFIPNLGPLDLSPIVAITILYILMEFVQVAIHKIQANNFVS
jgi:YggT family protein